MNNEPPEEIDFTRLLRRVDVENPRITKYVINWDEQNEELQQPYLPDASAETVPHLLPFLLMPSCRRVMVVTLLRRG